ncbi:MAG: tetratricopeptide repeat protein [Gemmatimonadaceae bacterium]
MIAHASRAVRLLPLAALFAAGGCFATRNDVRVVQTDLASFRTELLKANADQREALAAALRTLAVASDSVRVMSNRLTSVQGDVRGGLRDVNEQLIQVQELLKQSAGRMDQLRREQEIRANQAAMIPMAPPTGMPMTAADSAAALMAPVSPDMGPLQLYTNGRGQLARGSWSTAREIFQELLTNFPTSDRAPGAQIGIGETYAGEKQVNAALPAYAVVFQKYPDAPEAPTSLWKRALILIDLNRPAEAKPLLQQIISRYKNSDVYLQADEKLKTMR